MATSPMSDPGDTPAKRDLTDLLDNVCDEWMHTVEHLDLYDDRYSVAAKVLGEVPVGWAKLDGGWVQLELVPERPISTGRIEPLYRVKDR